MKNIRIIIDYKDQTYESDIIEMNDDQFYRTERDVIKAVSGESNYFSLKRKKSDLYFNKKILKKSVITIIEIK